MTDLLFRSRQFQAQLGDGRHSLLPVFHANGVEGSEIWEVGPPYPCLQRPDQHPEIPKEKKESLNLNTNKNEDLAGQAEVVQVPRASVPVNPEN